jgi:threonine/homoserine/homoserine lactone efflux protein
VDTDWLPLALAIAASPFPIIPVILLLFTPRALANASSFLAGWVIGIVTATTLFTLLTEVFDGRDSSPIWHSWVRIAVGLTLIGYGIRHWQTRARQDSIPGWMQSIDAATPGSALRLGLVLSALNPKILLLAGAGGLAIGAADLTAVTTARSIALFTVVAASTVAIPVVVYAVAGHRVDRPLRAAKDWLLTHHAAVMSVVMLAIGLAVTIKGTRGL